MFMDEDNSFVIIESFYMLCESVTYYGEESIKKIARLNSLHFQTE